MNNKIVFAALFLVGLATCFAQSHDYPKMRFSVHVIGEDGQPITGVQASVIYNVDGTSHNQTIDVAVTTDQNGDFTSEGYSESGWPAFRALLTKDGYYLSGIPTLRRFYTTKDGHWLPWDQTHTTVLRKIGTPIPLYARKMDAYIPSLDTPVGFDLEAADWVAPNGRGKMVDFLVTVTRYQYNNNNDFDVIALITFPNEGDGIQEVELPKKFNTSNFKWPREATSNGYVPKLEARNLWQNTQNGNTHSIKTAKETQAYFFRVRTMKKDNQIVSALYGKISGGIWTGPGNGKNAHIGFAYYLNPTPNDRNLEFSGESLFKNLSMEETTREP